jgi:hypothetical protein
LQNKIYCHAKKNEIGLVWHCQSKLVKSYGRLNFLRLDQLVKTIEEKWRRGW